MEQIFQEFSVDLHSDDVDLDRVVMAVETQVEQGRRPLGGAGMDSEEDEVSDLDSNTSTEEGCDKASKLQDKAPAGVRRASASPAMRWFLEQLLFSQDFDLSTLLLPGYPTSSSTLPGVGLPQLTREQTVDLYLEQLYQVPREPFDSQAQLNVQSVHFQPQRALQVALHGEPGAIRLPTLAKPWAGVRRWYQKVIGDSF